MKTKTQKNLLKACIDASRVIQDLLKPPRGRRQILAMQIDASTALTVIEAAIAEAEAELRAPEYTPPIEAEPNARLIQELQDILWKLEHFHEFKTPERNAFLENTPMHIRAVIIKAEED